MKAFFLIAVLSAPPTEQDLMIAELYEMDPVLAVEVLDVVDGLQQDPFAACRPFANLGEVRVGSFTATDDLWQYCNDINSPWTQDTFTGLISDSAFLNRSTTSFQGAWTWSDEPTPYDTLRDMGFSPEEADYMVLEILGQANQLRSGKHGTPGWTLQRRLKEAEQVYIEREFE